MDETSTLVHSQGRITTSPKIFSNDYFRVGEKQFKENKTCSLFQLTRVDVGNVRKKGTNLKGIIT